MKYWELLKEENEAVAERHELAMERIGHMKEEATVGEPYRAFFERTVQFIELIEETFQKQMDGTLAAMSQKPDALCGYTSRGVWEELCEPGLCGKRAGRELWSVAVISLYGDPQRDRLRL